MVARKPRMHPVERTDQGEKALVPLRHRATLDNSGQGMLLGPQWAGRRSETGRRPGCRSAGADVVHQGYRVAGRGIKCHARTALYETTNNGQLRGQCLKDNVDYSPTILASIDGHFGP